MANNRNIVDIQPGKIPPNAIELEEVVLGACLIDAAGLDALMSVIKDPNVFYKQQHVDIYNAMVQLYTAGEPVDLLTVSAQLKRNDTLMQVGGDYYLVQLMQQVGSAAHTEYHCRILLQQYIKRSVIGLCGEIIAISYQDETDSIELLSKFQQGIDKVSGVVSTGKKVVTYKEALQGVQKEVELLTSNRDKNVHLVGIPTGLLNTDKHTGGYRDGDLVIIAGRPGMGKTAKVIKTAMASCIAGIPVGFISLEMSVHQLAARTVAIDTDWHLTQLLKKGFEKKEYFQKLSNDVYRMGEYPLYIDDSAIDDISDIKIQAKKWQRLYGIKLLIVDYLQLCNDRSVRGNREQEVSSVSRKLKLLAKTLGIPVIALSQLSRSVETRGGSKRPLLSDLRESGAIEQDADIIEFIYRPGYYQIEMDECDYDDPKHKDAIAAGGNTEIIYAKYRGGSTGTAIVKWVADKTKFVDPLDYTENAEAYHEVEEAMKLPSVEEAFGPADNSNNKTNDEEPF